VEIVGFGELFLGEAGTASGPADVLPNGFPDGLYSSRPLTEAGTGQSDTI